MPYKVFLPNQFPVLRSERSGFALKPCSECGARRKKLIGGKRVLCNKAYHRTKARSKYERGKRLLKTWWV